MCIQPDPRSKRLCANGSVPFFEAKGFSVVRSEDSHLVLTHGEEIPEQRAKKLALKLAKKVVLLSPDVFGEDIPEEHRLLVGKITKCFGIKKDPWYEQEEDGRCYIRTIVSKVWKQEMEAYGDESGEIEPFGDLVQLVFPVPSPLAVAPLPSPVSVVIPKVADASKVALNPSPPPRREPVSL